MADTGTLLVISAPSGGGKGTLIKRLLSMLPQIGYSVSFTTRPPRPHEVHGRDYFFISRAEFDAMISAGGFLEWAEVHGNCYGTARAQVADEIAAGRDIILEIDVQGAANIQRLGVAAVSIFILPPSYTVLEKRLAGRATETPAQVALRMANARREVLEYHHFDYVIVNDDLDRASRQLAAIVIAENTRRERQTRTIGTILATFA